MSPIATAEEYVEAFLAVSDEANWKQLLMLQRQYRSPAKTITATQLADAVRYQSYSGANLWYGKLGRLVWEALQRQPPARPDGSLMYWTSLSTGNPGLSIGEHFQFVMRPEVAAALEFLGWV